MKKIFTKILALLCVFVFVFACACNSSNNNQNETNNGPDVVSGKYIVKDGNSEYCVVVPNDATEMVLLAAQEITYAIKEATSVSLDVVTEGESVNLNKGIFLGNTNKALEKSVTADADAQKSTGYTIKEVEDSIYLVGASDWGTLYGTYDLLYDLVKFRAYADDEVYIEKNMDSIPLYTYDEKFTPLIEWRLPYMQYIMTNQQLAPRMYSRVFADFFVTYGQQKWVHTCDSLMSFDEHGKAHPEWFSADGFQWCFSRALVDEEMFNTFYATYKAGIEEQPNAIYASVSQNDKFSWCNCSDCKAEKVKYGSNIAVVIKLMNKVAAKVKEDFPNREINVHSFSYHETAGALTYIDDSVMCADNVSIMYAPIRGNWTTDFSDDSNKSHLMSLEALSKVCNNLTMWAYDANFQQYFYCYNTFSGREERIEQMSKNNVSVLFSRQPYPTPQSLNKLKVFLTSQMSWKDSNMEELIADFCDHYYLNASDKMQEYINSYRQWTLYAYSELKMTTDCNQDGQIKSIYWPKGKLLEWEQLFNEMYNSIEIVKFDDVVLYEKLVNRIKLESLSYRYMLIEIYGSTYKATELDDMKRSFRADCYALGVSQYGEGKSIETTFSKWGI